jgi:hypothetical protein
MGKNECFSLVYQWLKDGRLGTIVDIINVMDRDMVVKNI